MTRRTPVDHRARKTDIIANSMRLFAQCGYKDVTFQMLSDHCGVARTVLYRYFRNKRQIFDSAIVLAMTRVMQKHGEILRAREPAAVRLRQICTALMATLYDHREFLIVVVDFVLGMTRAGHDMRRRVRTFTIGLRRILHTLLVYGIRHGEFRADADADRYTDLLYTQFESAVIRLAVTGDATLADQLDDIDEILKGLQRT